MKLIVGSVRTKQTTSIGISGFESSSTLIVSSRNSKTKRLTLVNLRKDSFVLEHWMNYHSTEAIAPDFDFNVVM